MQEYVYDAGSVKMVKMMLCHFFRTTDFHSLLGVTRDKTCSHLLYCILHFLLVFIYFIKQSGTTL